MKQWRCLRFDSETRWWIQVVQQRTDTEEQMPQEQFQRVKQKQNPSAESSEEDQHFTVTASPGNNAIRNQTHEAGKDLRRTRNSESGCCQDCQRSSQIKKAMEMEAEAEHHRGVGDQQSEINLARGKQPDRDSVQQHQFKIQAHRLDRSRTRTRDQQACLRRYEQRPPRPKKRKSSANPKLSW